jgi:hypothetical protein
VTEDINRIARPRVTRHSVGSVHGDRANIIRYQAGTTRSRQTRLAIHRIDIRLRHVDGKVSETYRGTHTASQGRVLQPGDTPFGGDLEVRARRRAAPCAGPRSNRQSDLTPSHHTRPVSRQRSLTGPAWAGCLVGHWPWIIVLYCERHEPSRRSYE